MKSLNPICGAAILSILAASPLLATTATSLSSFGGIEEPAQIYFPGSNTFQSDTFTNITDLGSGVFQMKLRYNTSGTMWWDGDRTTGNTDRQRAEVKTLGANQLIHQTFDYTTTWKINTGFVGSGAFCHITQLKPVDGVEGSSGAPMVVTSLESGSSAANVRYASASFSPANVFTAHTVRDITYTPGVSTVEKIRVRTTADGENTGQVLVSLNGDAFQGVDNVEVCRPSTTTYYPKWGFYRGASTTSGFGAADYIQHANVTANQITLPTTTMQAESLSATTSGTPTITTQSDAAASGGVVAYVNATGSGQWAEFTSTSLAAGTYQVKFQYKKNTSRGQHTVTIDGVQVGGTVDEYNTTSGYTLVTLGNITLGSTGTHKIRLTITGKNSASGAYTLAPDCFTFVGQ